MSLKNFREIKSHEPQLVRVGMTEVTDMNTRIRITSIDGLHGSYVKTEDYKELLAAYEKITSIKEEGPKDKKTKEKPKDKPKPKDQPKDKALKDKKNTK